MARDTISDVLAFVAVAKERSFTRAAAKLGVSQSALSHTIRGLESRLGVRLPTRTTRSVSATDAGDRLLQTVAPRLEEIEAELAAVSELGGKPAGTIRITAIDYAAFVPEDLARPHVEAGRSRYVLEDWFPTFPGLHVYYPSRRQSSRALALVVDALRHRH